MVYISGPDTDYISVGKIEDDGGNLLDKEMAGDGSRLGNDDYPPLIWEEV